jgi:hypothetical protein
MQQTKEPAQDTYLTPKELAVRWKKRMRPDGTIDLKKGAQILADQRSKGEGPPYLKVGRSVLYPMDELIAWEQGNTHLRGGDR